MMTGRRTRLGALLASAVICGLVLTAPALALDARNSIWLGVAPEMSTIDVAGEEVDTTLWRAATATDLVVVSPSLNSTVDDLAAVAATIAAQDCANVVAVDSSQASPDAPIYLAILDDLVGFGLTPDAEFSTLGSSATAARALAATQQRGGQAVFVLSPSDPPPLTAAEVAAYVGLYITTGDAQYRPMFDVWTAAGFEGHVVEGENHGTRFLTEAASQPIADEIVDHICGHPAGTHGLAPGIEQEDEGNNSTPEVDDGGGLAPGIEQEDEGNNSTPGSPLVPITVTVSGLLLAGAGAFLVLKTQNAVVPPTGRIPTVSDPKLDFPAILLDHVGRFGVAMGSGPDGDHCPKCELNTTVPGANDMSLHLCTLCDTEFMQAPAGWMGPGTNLRGPPLRSFGEVEGIAEFINDLEISVDIADR